jgi:hypothetical protein
MDDEDDGGFKIIQGLVSQCPLMVFEARLVFRCSRIRDHEFV